MTMKYYRMSITKDTQQYDHIPTPPKVEDDIVIEVPARNSTDIPVGSTDVLTVGFGESAQNTLIVAEVHSNLKKMIAQGLITGGHILLITGAASLPVTFALGHAVGHLYEVIGAYDPKLNSYVVSIAHHPGYLPGDKISPIKSQEVE